MFNNSRTPVLAAQTYTLSEHCFVQILSFGNIDLIDKVRYMRAWEVAGYLAESAELNQCVVFLALELQHFWPCLDLQKPFQHFEALVQIHRRGQSVTPLHLIWNKYYVSALVVQRQPSSNGQSTQS